ncbi:zinc metalloproteinase-disintegrin-like VLAIP-B isoform X2 [Lissotriton helveticus]
MTAPDAADVRLHRQCPHLAMPLRAVVGFLILNLTVMVSKVFALETLAGVKDYELVFPEKLYARHRGDSKVQYPDKVQYGFKVHGEDVVMHLERNKNLLAANYTETHYLPDGQQVTTSPLILDHCYYHGYIRNDSDSEASISLCNGVRGYFMTQGQRYHIEPLKITEGAEHAVYKYESLESTVKICGVTNYTWLRDPTKTFRFWTETQFKKYGQKMETVRNRIFEIINNVNLVYKTINIFVALIGIEIWSTNDLIEVTTDIDAVLEAFTKWRKETLLKRKINDNAQLLSNVEFGKSMIGLAFFTGMCSEEQSAAVIQDHSPSVLSVGATVAHEMGHNFGMEHDTRSCTCQDRTCIMTASLRPPPPKVFSLCSKKQYQEFILNDMPMCVKNKPDLNDLIAPPVCGNGYIEADEQCDCGTPEECQDHCCEAAFCKLKPGAVCAVGECCLDCQFKDVGAVCRPSKDECDLADFCDGKSAACTSDRFRASGFPCMKGQGYCHMGKCPTLNSQCEGIWGLGAQQGTDSCFNLNLRKVDYGYCSYSKGRYIACKRNSIKCGKLYCIGGSDTSSLYGVTFRYKACKTVLPESAYIEGFAMSQNGVKCGSNLICNKGQCVDMERIYRSAKCASKCKGHAVCDHELKCHCEVGWSPPTCDRIFLERKAAIANDSLLIGFGIAIPLAIIIIIVIVIKRKSIRACFKK